MNDKEHLIFIIGAGASVPLGIPSMKGFTNEAEEIIGKKYASFASGPMGANPIKQLRKISTERPWDLEKALKCIREAKNLQLNMGLKLYRRRFLRTGYEPIKTFDKNIIKICDNYRKVEKELLAFIRNRCSEPDYKKAKEIYSPIFNLSNKYILDIFTTNYDGAIEKTCIDLGYKYSDGFKHDSEIREYIWDEKCLGNKNINIFKLHGSITWYKKDEKIINIPHNIKSEDIEEVIIYPTESKQTLSLPYRHIFRKFEEILFKTKICVSIGHSYNDKYIRNLIIDRLDEKKFLIYMVNGRYTRSEKQKIFGTTNMVNPVIKNFEDFDIENDIEI